jgi:hypothetical protein
MHASKIIINIVQSGPIAQSSSHEEDQLPPLEQEQAASPMEDLAISPGHDPATSHQQDFASAAPTSVPNTTTGTTLTGI